MTTLTCRIATTQRQLDDALRVRWEVFGAELELLGRPVRTVPREINAFDTLETTVHLVVYANEHPVEVHEIGSKVGSPPGSDKQQGPVSPSGTQRAGRSSASLPAGGVQSGRVKR